MSIYPFPPPIAPKIPKELVNHGHARIDNYYWMRDRDDPATMQYLAEENAYTEAVLESAKELRKQIYDEIVGRIQQTDLTVPVKDGPYYYYSRTEEGKQYPIWCRRQGSVDAPEEVILDGNLLAQGQAYFSLGGLSVSDDHHLLAYSVDHDGSESYTVHVKDLRTGELFPEAIPETSAGLNWAADNRTIFYTTYDPTRRPEKVKRHALGSDPANDLTVFHEADSLFSFEVERTRSKRYLLITSVNASKTSEVWYLDAAQPDHPFRVIAPRRKGVEYYAEHHGDRFLIRTNDGGATHFKLMTAPVEMPEIDRWHPLVPARVDVTLDHVEAFDGFLVLHTRAAGLPNLEIRDFKTEETHVVEFPEPAYTVFTNGNREYHTETLRFTYASLITPSSVYDYDMRRRTRELKKQAAVLGGYDPALYTSERLFADTTDGKKVPISLVYRQGMVNRNGESPLLLNGYGAYGINSDPGFSHAALSLLDRGWTYAIAHIRGGSELGRQWFEDGRMLQKKNSFSDFIHCAEHLVRERYTSPSKLAAMGGSAGGLLMGAVLNKRPDLFHAVVARVPFVDVVTTMLDPSIPLTTGEYDQWGNPEERIYYDAMLEYSPYDNVEAKAYPRLLVVTGLNDPRVAFWEPVKWAAKLRAMKTDNNPLLLKIHMGAGHGGASGRYERIEETALIWAFLLESMNESR